MKKIIFLFTFLMFAACNNGSNNLSDESSDLDKKKTEEGVSISNSTEETFISNEIEKDTDANAESFSQTALPQNGEKIAILKSNYGDIKIRLFPEQAPQTVANFIKLAEEGFYDNLIFHRVIKNFMIQGGDPIGDGTGGPGYTTEAEFSTKLSHIQGAVATARQGDMVNPEKRSSGSQFYIVHPADGAHFLDNEYTVFGQVFAGQEVVDKIANVDTDRGDKPTEDVIIESIDIISYE